MAVNEKRLILVKSRLALVSETKTLIHMLVWGKVKTGKTSFASSGPKPIMFLAESGQMSVRAVKDLMVYPVNQDGSYRRARWKDAWDFLYFLRYGEHDRKTVSVDTMSSLTRHAMKYILKNEEDRDEAREPGVPTQPTWGRLATEMTEFMEELEAVCKTRGMHLIYTAQERTLFDEKAESEGANVVPDFPPSIRSFITQKPDILARTFIENAEEEDIEKEPEIRYGMIFRDPELLVGQRVTPIGASSPFLPRRAFNVTIPKLLERIDLAKKEATSGRPKADQGRDSQDSHQDKGDSKPQGSRSRNKAPAKNS